MRILVNSGLLCYWGVAGGVIVYVCVFLSCVDAKRTLAFAGPAYLWAVLTWALS